MYNIQINMFFIMRGELMNLYEVTSLLKHNTIDEVALKLNVTPSKIINFLESNALTYYNNQVMPIMDLKEMAVTKAALEPQPPKVEYVRRRTMGADVDTFKKWDKFTNTHDKFKIYELLTLALNEFMDKYK